MSGVDPELAMRTALGDAGLLDANDADVVLPAAPEEMRTDLD